MRVVRPVRGNGVGWACGSAAVDEPEAGRVSASPTHGATGTGRWVVPIPVKTWRVPGRVPDDPSPAAAPTLRVSSSPPQPEFMNASAESGFRPARLGSGAV